MKYLSVFFHVYYIDKILAQLKEVEQFDNSTIKARVSFRIFEILWYFSSVGKH